MEYQDEIARKLAVVRNRVKSVAQPDGESPPELANDAIAAVSAAMAAAQPEAAPASPNLHSTASDEGLKMGVYKDQYEPLPPPPSCRSDGWLPEVRVKFLQSLASYGNIAMAALFAQRSRQSAYDLKRRDPDFARAWQAALLLAREAAEDVLQDRAIMGVEEDIYHQGKLIGTRRRYDNRLLLAHLARLDKMAEQLPVQRGAARFDEMLAAIAAGDDTAAIVSEPGQDEIAQMVGEAQAAGLKLQISAEVNDELLRPADRLEPQLEEVEELDVPEEFEEPEEPEEQGEPEKPEEPAAPLADGADEIYQVKWPLAAIAPSANGQQRHGVDEENGYKHEIYRMTAAEAAQMEADIPGLIAAPFDGLDERVMGQLFGGAELDRQEKDRYNM